MTIGTKYRTKYLPPYISARAAVALALLALMASCSALKLDKEGNCLNEKAACFKWDKTRPKVDSFETQPLRDASNSVTALQYIDVTFSEEIKNGELASNYTFKSAPGVHNFSVTSVQKISAYTYRLVVGGGLISSGQIELNIAPLTDYNGNLMDTITPVLFQGSVNIGIVSKVNHNGVSNGGGYSSVDFKFYHTYTSDVTNANSYTIRLTSGAQDCTIGTVLASGSNLAPNLANEITLNVPVASFAPGMNRLVVCVNNLNNPNATNSASWPIIRDDVAPVLTFTPAGDSYAQPKTITLTCGNNADQIAYTMTSQQGSSPADPTAPTFNAATGAIITGLPYSGSIVAANPANPTYTKFLWRCIDIAGNLSAAPSVVQFYVDSTIPDVVVNLDSSYRQYVSAVNPNTTLKFSTDQVSKTYNIRRNGTTCAGGGDGVLLATGTTDAVAGNPSTVPLNITTHFTTDNTTYPVRICVAGTGIQWGTSYLEITRDGTAPTIAASVLSGSYGALQSVEFTCSDAFGSVHNVAYNVTTADGAVVPAAPMDPAFDTASGSATSGALQTGPLSPADRKTSRYAFRCIDRAGNVSTVGYEQYTIDATLPTVNFVSANRTAVTANAGGYPDVTLTWSANRDQLTYRIRRVADCNHAGTPANTIASGTVSGVNVNQVVTIAATAFPTNGVTYPIRICVYNYVGTSVYQTTAVSVMRDDTGPAISNAVATIATVDPTNYTLSWNAATDTGGSGVVGYRIYRTDAVSYPTYPVTPTYTATSSPATIAMPDTQKYFLKIVPFDAAGNVPTAAPLAYTELTTKPAINIVITGNAGSLMLTDGSQSPVAVASNMAWTTSLGTGQAYTFNITSQPAGQVCAIKEKQFGTLSSDLTININCVNGQMVGGRFQAVAASGMNSMLQRTRSDVWVSTFAVGGELPNSVAVAGGFVFFGTDGDCDAGAPVSYCIYKRDVNSAGSPTLVVNNIPGIVRGLATDGTNLYYGTLGDNRLYKVPLAGGTPAEITSGLANPFAIALEGTDAYICNRAANEIVKVDLLTGAKTSVVTGVAAPLGLTIAGANLYFTLYGTHAIFRVPKTGGTVTTVYGAAGTPAETDGNTTAARFNEPHDLTYDGKDNLFVADYGGHTVRRVRISTGRVTTIVGDSSISSMTYSNGVGPTAKLPRPVGVTTDGRNLFVSLHGDRRIIKLTEQKLTGHWPLAGAPDDYGSDGTAVAGTWSGAAAYGTGRFGEANGAALFDGSKYITTKDITITVNQPFTLAAWVNVGDYGLPRPIFGNMSNYEFHLYVGTNGSVNFQNWHSSGALSNYLAGTSGGVIKPNTWVHVAYVFRNNSGPQPGGRIFINGHDMTVSSTLANSGALDSFATSVTIGAALSFASKFVGSIADARIYNRTLTDAEINELAQDASSVVVGSSFNTGATELLSYFPIDSLSGNDYGPAGLNLSNSSASPVNGIDGDYPGAVDLQGSTGSNLSVASAAGLPRLDAPRSFCAFVRPTAQPAAGIRFPIVSYGGTTANFQGAELVYFNQSGTDYRVGMTKIGDSVDAQIKLPIYAWSHVCGTNDGAVSRLYVNGVELPATGSNAQVFSSTAGVLKVGTRVYDPSNTFAFKGNVDEVRIYNKALSAAEIRQLSAIMPAGLIARYDFDGDTQDVSGFGNSITNSGATPTDDRYGLNSRAYKFGGTSGMQVSAVQAVTSNITLALWIQPNSLPASLTGLLDNWNVDATNTGATGGGLIFNGNTIDILTRGGGSGGALPSMVDCSTGFKPPIGAYSHVAATVAFTGTARVIAFYVNGGLVKTCNVATTAPPVFNNGVNFYLAKNIWPGSFDGNIDDVRIYNRALTQVEIQQLVQQPNKWIYVTNGTYTGNLGGIAGADAKCNAADANKPAGAGTFKALIVDSGASLLRRACTTGNCATGGVGEGIDWVLRSNVTYLRGLDGARVFTANFNGVFDFGSGSFASPIHTTSYQVWTGINFGVGNQWTIDGGPGQCNSWTGSGTNGVYGDSAATTQTASATPTGAIYNGFELLTCITARRLYCVEQ